MYIFEHGPKVDFENIRLKGVEDAELGVVQTMTPTVIVEIQDQLASHRDKELRRAQEKLHKIQAVADEAQKEIEIIGIEHKFNTRLESLASFHIGDKISQIDEKAEDLKLRNKDFMNFRRKNKISRMPIRTEVTKKNVYVTIAILFLLEATMNAIAFKDIGGLLLAYTLSFSQALINIVTCYIVGTLVLTRVITLPSNKTLPFIFLFIGHVIFIAWLNLALGLYRAIITKDALVTVMSPEALQISLMPFSNLGEFEMSSALVSTVGLVLALLAYIKGYYSDDPIQGYGERYKAAVNARTIVNDCIKRVREEEGLVEIDVKAVGSDVHSEGLSAIQRWSQEINTVQKIFTDYPQLLKELDNSYERGQKVYSQAYKYQSGGDQTNGDACSSLFSKDDFDLKEVFFDAYEYFLTDEKRLERKQEMTMNFESKFTKINDNFNEKLNNLLTELDDYLKNLSLPAIGS